MNDTRHTSLVEELIARLSIQPDAARFVGKPVDLDALDPVQLGALWPALRRAEQLPFADPRHELVRRLKKHIEDSELAPALDDTTALLVFRDIPPGSWSRALMDLPFLAQQPTPALQAELIRIKDEKPAAGFSDRPYVAFALSHFAGGNGIEELRRELAERYADSPYRLREFEVLNDLSSHALLAMAGTIDGYFAPTSFGLEKNDVALMLTEEPAYLEFAHDTLVSALKRLNSIHDGGIPYKADDAFSTDDAQVISRAARIAAHRDDVWLRGMIGPMLMKACVAPTAAKTCPCQSLAVALGHAIESIPTPEGIVALREALAAVRHAGVEKKLSRNLKPAMRALGERPDIALRMTAGAKPDKKQLTMLAACMESGFWKGMTLNQTEWRERLLDTPLGLAFSGNVVWLEERIDGSRHSFAVDAAKSGPQLRKLDGSAHALEEGSEVMLWHPLHANETERDGWRGVFMGKKTRQPVRQVFREYYGLPGHEAEREQSSMFEGHVVSVRTLIGLARREGWNIRHYEGLTRVFGDVRVIFQFPGNLYPGATGHTQSGKLWVQRKGGRRWLPVKLAQLHPCLFSEIARAADLLVSVSGFALADEQANLMSGAACAPPFRVPAPKAKGDHLDHLSTLPLSVMAANRRSTLSLVFAKQIENGSMSVEERHVRIGEFAVHVATARVTKNGEAVDMAEADQGRRLGAVPWLPYDEILLQRIVDTVAALLG